MNKDQTIPGGFITLHEALNYFGSVLYKTDWKDNAWLTALLKIKTWINDPVNTDLSEIEGNRNGRMTLKHMNKWLGSGKLNAYTKADKDFFQYIDVGRWGGGSYENINVSFFETGSVSPIRNTVNSKNPNIIYIKKSELIYVIQSLMPTDNVLSNDKNLSNANIQANSMVSEHIYEPRFTGQVLRLPDVISKTGVSRSTIYSMMDAGSFPKSIPLGGHSIGWLEADVDSWIENQVTSKIKK